MQQVRINKGDKDIVIKFAIPDGLNPTESVFYKYVLRQLVHLESVDGLAGQEQIIDLEAFAAWIKTIVIATEDAKESEVNVWLEDVLTNEEGDD